MFDTGEPETISSFDGKYSFRDLAPGLYVVRKEFEPGHAVSFPETKSGILWPTGTSNVAQGNVSPSSASFSLAEKESFRQNYSITMPATGGLSNTVDVFLLFDDTGSFVNNSPIVRGAFPTIMSQLQSALPGVDLGFGVGRFEEYANFAQEYSTGRPFVLNQPIVAASTPGYQQAIQSALNRTTPGYGGDQPETDIEALYQLVTGLGFDGNNNGSTTESGAAGLASTQLLPGGSGDVPSFTSFTVDPSNGVIAADGKIGGGGFRTGSLPVILLATDTGFAYQPKGESSIVGTGGVTLPVNNLTGTSRSTTPNGRGAGLQETVTALNALGSLVIGLGTNAFATSDPRLALESISRLTGATNQSTTTIPNGTADPIAPGDPLYFQIASGFATSVSAGVVNAIKNAVTTVAMDISVRASDPRVRLVNHTGTLRGVTAGQLANFDIEFIGDGAPHRFDLQFIREGTDVVLGSIPIVIGTPIPGDGYHFEDLEEGETEDAENFGDFFDDTFVINTAPSFLAGSSPTVSEDSGFQAISPWATHISSGFPAEDWQSLSFEATSDNPDLFTLPPTISPDGTLTFQSANNAFGTASVSVRLKDNGGTAHGGVDTSLPQLFTITISAVNDAPIAAEESFTVVEDHTLLIAETDLLRNDVDVDGDRLTLRLGTSPLHGSLSRGVDGVFTYTPAENYFGDDFFTYFAFDGIVESQVVTVTIQVTPVNDLPLVSDDEYSTIEDTLLDVTAPGVLANDLDPDFDTVSSVLVILPTHGSLTLHANGSFQYIPDIDFNGMDFFSYSVTDSQGMSALARATIHVSSVNDRPIALDDSHTLSAGSSLAVAANGVLKNDYDVDGDPLISRLLSLPIHGQLTFSSDGSFSYTADSGFVGSDSFTYQADDGLLQSAPATVILQVTPRLDSTPTT